MPNNGGRDSGHEEKKRPVHTVRLWTGSATVEAAIWRQTVEEGDRVSYNVTLTRSYKDGEDYKQSKGFWPQDLPHAMLALQAAYFWIADQRD